MKTSQQRTTRKRPASKKDINAARGRRYSATEKTEIIALVHELNADHGRGGITAASNKFGVSPLTISHWIRDAGIQSPVTSRRHNVNHADIFRELADLHEQITAKRSELSQLETKFNRLKTKL